MLVTNLTTDPLLTQLATGYSNEEFVGNALFPEVSVEKETGKIPMFGKAAFMLPTTLRAMRGASNRLPTDTADTKPFRMEEHDLEYPIDYREIQESDNALLQLQQHGTNLTTELIRLRIEHVQAQLAQDPDNYESGSAVEITSSNSKWDSTHADSVPVENIQTGHDKIRSLIGRRANTAIIGYEAYKALRRHSTVRAYLGDSTTKIITIDILKEILEIENIYIGKAIYSDDAGDFHDVWGDNMVMAYVRPGQAGARSMYEPNFGYTLRKTGMPNVDSRDDATSGGKIQLVRSTDIVIPVLTGAIAGYFIENVL